MSAILVYVKDALLCLLICSAFANFKKKAAIKSLFLIVALFIMGLDL